MDNNTPSPIEVGTGVTFHCGSDCYPYTVVEVKSPRKIIVQGDNWKRTDKNGISEDQTYEYTPNPNGERRVITLRKNGRWCEVGSNASSCPYTVGHRRMYHDPCK
jgi:hypothetical protein